MAGLDKVRASNTVTIVSAVSTASQCYFSSGNESYKIVQLLFEGGDYFAQSSDCAATI